MKVRSKVSLWRLHVTVLAVEKQQYVSLYCAYTRTDGRDEIKRRFARLTLARLKIDIMYSVSTRDENFRYVI